MKKFNQKGVKDELVASCLSTSLGAHAARALAQHYGAETIMYKVEEAEIT
jgi:hypothetical protein